MKKALSLFLAAAMSISIIAVEPITAPVAAEPADGGFAELTANELVAQMHTGWNLGNTFDAHQSDSTTGLPSWLNPTDLDAIETMWLNGKANKTTQSLIKKVKAEGFDTIRIPVTWYKCADKNNNWTIRADYMARVKQVVDWAVEEDMYILLNSHHDDKHYHLNTGDASSEEHLGYQFITNIWRQISEVFKDYDEKLVFEGLNEPRTLGSSGEWSGGNATERANLNKLEQAFLDTVRASGGNNEHRILLMPTYGASATGAALNGFALPDDDEHNPEVNKIILSVHTYSPFGWAHDGNGSYGGMSSIVGDLDRVQARAAVLDVPVILGEWGSTTNSKPAADREIHADDYVTAARERNMVAAWWDNNGNFGVIPRQAPHNPNAGVVRGIMRGLGGNIVNQKEYNIVKDEWFFAGIKDNGEFNVRGLYNEWSDVYNANYSTGGVYGYELEVAPAKNASKGIIKFESVLGTDKKESSIDIEDENANMTVRLTGTENLLAQDTEFTVKADGESINFYVVSVTFLGQNGQKLSSQPLYFCEGALKERVFTTNYSGKAFGWDIELWSQNESGSGTVDMTVREDGSFMSEWNNTSNSLFRSGKRFERKTKKISDIDDISFRYASSGYTSDNTSYLGIYGWLEDGAQMPLIEWYIVDNWLTYRPGGPSAGVAHPGSEFLGTVEANGSVYDIYKTPKTNAPSIDGNRDFTQIFSVRRDKRTSGMVDVSAHFAAWADKGVDTGGYLYEVSLLVEGYGGSTLSSGKADVTGMCLKFGDDKLCTHPYGKDGDICDWCKEPDPPMQKPSWCHCNQDPCVCPTFWSRITGGSWSVQDHAVTGSDVKPEANDINPELIKKIKLTFDLTVHECDCTLPTAPNTEEGYCLMLAINGGGSGWKQRSFCYKDTPSFTMDLSEFGWDPNSGWLKLAIASWVDDDIGSVLVEVLDENNRPLRLGQKEPTPDCDCDLASCVICSWDGRWKALGNVDGRINEQNKAVDIFDALEILKYLVNMEGSIKKDGVVDEVAMQAAIISDNASETNPPAPTIFCALEILKYLVSMTSKVDGTHIHGTPSAVKT